MTVITGWVLGKGPCGPGCSVADVGSQTHDRRLQVIRDTGNPAIFGNWSTEQELGGQIWIDDITDIVNRQIQGDHKFICFYDS